MKKIAAGQDKFHSPQGGFTLLELAIVLAVGMVITTAAIPYFIRKLEIDGALKTVKEVQSIQEGSKWFYINNNRWPTGLQELKNQGFLPAGMSNNNIWNWGYGLGNNGNSLSVWTGVPNTVVGALTRSLPNTTTQPPNPNNGYIPIASTIPLPGQEASLAGVTSLAQDAWNRANNAQNTANWAANTANDAWNMAQSSAVANGPIDEGTPRTMCPTGWVVVGTWHEDGYGGGLWCQRLSRY